MNRQTKYYWRSDVHSKDVHCWRKDACKNVDCNFIHPRDYNAAQSRHEDETAESTEYRRSRGDQFLDRKIYDARKLQNTKADDNVTKVDNTARETNKNVNMLQNSEDGKGEAIISRGTTDQSLNTDNGSRRGRKLQKAKADVNVTKVDNTAREANKNVNTLQRGEDGKGEAISSRATTDQSSGKISGKRRNGDRTVHFTGENTQKHLQQGNATKVGHLQTGKNSQSRSVHQKVAHFIPFCQPTLPNRPEWHWAEMDALQQHRNIIDDIKEKISQILLSDDYCIESRNQEANIEVLRAKIVELESQITIFDSIKSRACRELASKPTELGNQIFREIYRLKCQLGAFTKRLEMEKYFTSGHRFLIVQGQTGSGKSTQIPQYVADHPRFYGKKIVCTQPRKLAAVSLARRVSFEYSGGIVRNDLSYIGYQVSGDRRENKGCRIEFVTEGIMLERIMKGDMESFKNVGCIIVDEAHERSIICDLLLGSFKKPDPRWMDVLVIATSATIDLTLFSEFFMNAPIVQIEGRTFPVDIVYQPIAAVETKIQFAVSRCALQIHLNCKSSPGDILCFLPGLDDITNAASIFEKELKKVCAVDLLAVKILTLYGKQDPDKQAQVFEKLDPSAIRKVIFATDVAETSVTIDGIMYVVDSGVKKEVVFDPERNVSSLKINSISQSSAIQRAGRCGRTQPGVCYRLYSQDEFESMKINAAPEVLCKPISLAVLTLLELSIDPENFYWINAPSCEAILSAEKELSLLGAVDAQRKPTELGKLIAKCQQDPKIMKIVYNGCVEGFGEAACSIASILSVSNAFFWNGNDVESKALAIQKRKEFAMPEGDIVTMYRIFENFISAYNGRHTQKSESSGDATDSVKVKLSASKWCSNNFLNAKSMFMALTTKNELINQLKRTKIWSKFRFQNKVPTNLEVQQLMCSGYFLQCARVFYSKNKNIPIEYFALESDVAGRLDFRSSINLLDVDPPPKWIVYDKIVRLPQTIFPLASVMDEDWLKTNNYDFYETCLRNTENLPTNLIEKSMSQVSFRMIVGKNFCNVDALEKELGCLLTGVADTGKMHLYCTPAKKMKVEQQIDSKINEALAEIKKQVIEENYKGQTRLVVGEGYEIHESLFEKEFATFYIKNVKLDLVNKTALKNFLTMNNEHLQSIQYIHQDKTYTTAVAKFSSKADAESAYERLSLMDGFNVSPCIGAISDVRHGLTSRLRLTWPTATSKGIANVFFNTPEGANRFLDSAHHIYPEVVVHVIGKTERSVAKSHGLQGNVVQAPLTYLRLPKNQRGCRFRFDVSALDQMPNKHQVNYKVRLNGLKQSVDKFELTTTLSVYDPKNIVVEYENFVAPAIGNGLTDEEKSTKLEPLKNFIKADTKTSDFFNRRTGVAGISIFFASNSIAKEAYNFAKAKYDSARRKLAPHHLEIEFTHTMSIQIGLYKFLRSDIVALQKDASEKGITSKMVPIQDNTKMVVIRFQMCKHVFLAWLQEKMDELIRPTKFNCVHSDVLFSRTGRLKLAEIAKRTFINWNDESHIVWIYGSPDVKEKIRKDIEQLATHLHSLDVLDKEILLKKTVRINCKDSRSIEEKCVEANVDFYHFHGNRMYISGSQSAVDAVVQYLVNNNIIWSRPRRQGLNSKETRECGLCLMPPDNTFIVLSVCGHLFCSDCIGAMLDLDPPPFPIKCPICGEHVALYDIKKLAPAKSLEKVLELAVIAFQHTHNSSVRICPSPGCQQLLCYDQRTTGTNGGDFLFCDQCLTSYCVTCSSDMNKPVKSHEDDSCEDVQNGVSNLVYKHVRIIQETIFNLSCPNCSSAFFEFDGCVAVTCGTCKAGFCGLCLQNCGTDAHNHVLSCAKNPKNPKDYYVEKSQLDAVHLDMRNQKLKDYLDRNRFNAKVHEQIIEKIRKDLMDLRMKIPVSLADTHTENSNSIATDYMAYVRQIQEKILTLSCPQCMTAFFDFDGCAAVTCNLCKIEFCGLCLDFAGSDVATHVTDCQRNPKKGNLFLSSSQLQEIHNRVRSDRIQTYFDEQLTDSETRSKVLSIIRRDLNDLQITLPDITARRRQPGVPLRFPQIPIPAMVRPREDPQLLHRDFVYLQMQRNEPVRRPVPPPRRECCIL